MNRIGGAMLLDYLPALWQEHLLRIALTVGCCFLIGFNREKIHRPAGLRTHILVGLGATLIMLIGEELTKNFADVTALSRMGAQVISGIGFLGAGTIITDGGTVKGLTTAASLWAVACVGLAIGSGYYLGGICVSLTIYLVLVGLGGYKSIQRETVDRTVLIHGHADGDGNLVERVKELFIQNQIQILKYEKMMDVHDPKRYAILYHINYSKSSKREEAIQSVLMMDKASKIGQVGYEEECEQRL